MTLSPLTSLDPNLLDPNVAGGEAEAGNNGESVAEPLQLARPLLQVAPALNLLEKRQNMILSVGRASQLNLQGRRGQPQF